MINETSGHVHFQWYENKLIQVTNYSVEQCVVKTVSDRVRERGGERENSYVQSTGAVCINVNNCQDRKKKKNFSPPLTTVVQCNNCSLVNMKTYQVFF